MAGEVLLDSNIVIAIFGGEPAARDYLERATEVFLPATALGELNYGARRSRRVADNLARIEEFVRSIQILPCDSRTARIYGELKQRLKLSGRPIPENDIWIAAAALQHHLTLVSRDAHFEHIEHLAVESWS